MNVSDRNHSQVRSVLCWLSLGLLVALTLTACEARQLEPVQVAVEEDALVNARPENGDPAVGWIGSCTATLIGRSTALTAAHCGADGSRVSFCTYSCGNIYECVGICVGGTVHRFPGYDGTGDWDRDAAVITLDQDYSSLTGIVPLRVGGVPVDDNLIDLVGFGCVDDHDNGIGQKRRGTNRIAGLHDQTIDIEDTSQAYGCHGDSGGPGLVADCQKGIIVGSDTIFFDTDYELTRTDTKLAWIQSVSGDPSVLECWHSICGDAFCQYPDSCGVCPECGACPPSPCGNGVCESGQGEECFSCPQDCGECPACRRGWIDCCGDGICTTPAVCRKFGCP